MQAQQNWYKLFKTLTCSLGVLAGYKLIRHQLKSKPNSKSKINKKQSRARIISTLDETNLRKERSTKYQFEKHNARVIKIVFTGGPCSGKTTAITSTQELLKDLGFTVHIVPEAATFISNAGGQLDISSYPEILQRQFQSNLLRLQLSLEDRFCDLSIIENNNNDKPGILLCDRGLLDVYYKQINIKQGSAYMSKENFQIMLDDLKSDIVSLRDKRYDGIIHLTTCADGAKDYYTLENNSARHEKNLEFAVWLDRSLLGAWQGHPYHYHIKAATSFSEKIKLTQQTVLQIIGVPSTVKFSKKFLLKNYEGNKSILKFLSPEITTQQCMIEDTFLKLEDKVVEKKVRKRDQNGLCSYLFIKSIMDLNQQRSATKSRISGKQYLRYLNQVDTNYNKIMKLRTCFIMGARNFIIEEHLDHQTLKPCFSILIVLIENNNEEKEMPPLPDFLEAGIHREVTDEQEYFDYNIAKSDWKFPERDRSVFGN